MFVLIQIKIDDNKMYNTIVNKYVLAIAYSENNTFTIINT